MEPEEYVVTTIEKRPTVVQISTKVFEPVEYMEEFEEKVPIVEEY